MAEYNEFGIKIQEDCVCAGDALAHSPENVVATIGYKPKGSFSDKKKIKGFDGEVAAMSEDVQDKILNQINESFPKVGSLQTDSQSASQYDKDLMKRNKERFCNIDPDVPEGETYGTIVDCAGNIIHDGEIGLAMYDELFKSFTKEPEGTKKAKESVNAKSEMNESTIDYKQVLQEE